MVPGGLQLPQFVLWLLFPILLFSFLQDLIPIANIYVTLEALHDLFPIDGELKFSLLF